MNSDSDRIIVVDNGDKEPFSDYEYYSIDGVVNQDGSPALFYGNPPKIFIRSEKKEKF